MSRRMQAGTVSKPQTTNTFATLFPANSEIRIPHSAISLAARRPSSTLTNPIGFKT
jgi:hypothetical protein